MDPPFPIACCWSRVAVIILGAAHSGEEREWRAGDHPSCNYRGAQVRKRGVIYVLVTYPPPGSLRSTLDRSAKLPTERVIRAHHIRLTLPRQVLPVVLHGDAARKEVSTSSHTSAGVNPAGWAARGTLPYTAVLCVPWARRAPCWKRCHTSGDPL